uniref:Uncharacterized protein n=1 Tax=Meloidogyne incognita TaxID=6306 RepID=A0A914NVD8_MELIC
MKGTDLNNLIEVRNDDLGEPAKYHCLLLAVQLTLMYINMDNSPKEKMNFQRIIAGKGARSKTQRYTLIKDMLIQMKRHGIRYPLKLQEYNVEEHAPLIQKYFNEKFPGEYRLAVIGEYGQMKPL